ncbi:sodium hydrogen exchanger 1-like isoform X1 [Olea europaea subsp. europaea]|uniref:Sodium hydrogen exchanger 1-like isoform X1 n=1 Tax=Olea europaea subsp. europaea TaxID=158383 RepID=A0A8S0Q9U3_OLEEU|nr:sodium hydrogen exchanger 1-like isoform X1 [Olea europaea subsp. europaea]
MDTVSELGAWMQKLYMLSTSAHASVVSMNLFVALLCGCIVIGHLLEENRLVFSEDLLFIYLLLPIIFNAGFQVKKKQFFRNFITIMLFGAVDTLISCAVISNGVVLFFRNLGIGFLDIGDYLAIGAIFAATDSFCTLPVLSQDETPLLYSLVFGEGVVNDATSVVLFNAIQSSDMTTIDPTISLHFIGSFLYLFLASTLLGVLVSVSQDISYESMCMWSFLFDMAF